MHREWETRVKRWRQKAVDREEWTSAIKESRALQGLRAKNKVKYYIHGIAERPIEMLRLVCVTT
jgi:hypothetical protein